MADSGHGDACILSAIGPVKRRPATCGARYDAHNQPLWASVALRSGYSFAPPADRNLSNCDSSTLRSNNSHPALTEKCRQQSAHTKV